MSKKNVLIIGANGITGRLICEKLANSQDYQPTAMIRKESQKEFFEELGVPTVMGDLEKDFSSAYKDMNLVVFAAGSGSSTGKDKTIAVDQEGAKKSVDLALENGIEKYVMLSSMGAGNPDPDSPIHFYLEAKHEADEYLKKSGISYSIVRPGGLTDDAGKGKIQAAYALNKRGKISREDVAGTLIYVLNKNIASNSSFEILEGEHSIQEAIENL